MYIAGVTIELQNVKPNIAEIAFRVKFLVILKLDQQLELLILCGRFMGK